MKSTTQFFNLSICILPAQLPALFVALFLAFFLALGSSRTYSSDAPVDEPSLHMTPWAESVLIRLGEPALVTNTPDGRLEDNDLSQLIKHGEALFSAHFTTLDGLGRPYATQAIVPTKRKRPVETTFQRVSGMDANACSSCHNVPRVGGAGDFTANVFVSEGFNLADFDSVDPQFSNERNTNHLFGAGLIELLAREISNDLQQIRAMAIIRARQDKQPVTVRLQSKGIDYGEITARPSGILELDHIDGIDPDLVVRPFSQKGVMTSLRQFTINALNHHHGIQANERFGARWTGEDDFDQDGIANEFSPANVSALVAWQATRPVPGRRSDLSPAWLSAAQRGENHFLDSGCDSCHRPTLPLRSLRFDDPGNHDMAGTLRADEGPVSLYYDLQQLAWTRDLQRDDNGHWLVPLFGDLKRHRIADDTVSTLGNELLSQRFVGRDIFMTAELWGVGSTAPYGHRGNLATLTEVILAHGGEASQSRLAFERLDATQQLDLVAYLKTLVIE